MSHVLNATARGQSPALRVAVWAAGAIRVLSSVSAHNAMEAVDVAAMFAAVVDPDTARKFEQHAA